MKILIVEDSMFVQNVFRKLILDYFPTCEIVTANDGLKGYQLYEEHKPDLITTDLLMPNLTGKEMVKKIREKDKETKILVISADVQQATKEEVEELGIDGFVNKPITGEKVDVVIKLLKEVQHAK